MNDVALEVKQFNAGRDPAGLALKLEKMRKDPFLFLRGSCHLFYAGLPDHLIFSKAPLAWICGDLHLENFGSFKGDNRLAYFDINDFDEAVLAPCTWDLLRFVVSVHLAAPGLALDAPEADLLGRAFVAAYAQALASGKARWVERDTAEGLVRELLDGLRGRTRVQLLNERTESQGRHRRIRIQGRKTQAVDDEVRAAVAAMVRGSAAARADPGFFQVLDVARRFAGTASLGLERYVVLVEGKGSPDGNYLLDLKQAGPSSLLPHLRVKQVRWASDAERVVTLQNRMQAIPMAFLQAMGAGNHSYTLRGLQPSQDRVDLENWKGKLRRLEELMTVMGQLAAWAHLRGSGRSSSAIADELVNFGRRADWQAPLGEAAARRSAAVMADWRAYAEAYDQGYFA